MLKQIAWNTFKTTGNINTMLELLEVDKTLEKINNNEQKHSMIDGINNQSESVIMKQFKENLKRANQDIIDGGTMKF